MKHNLTSPRPLAAFGARKTALTILGGLAAMLVCLWFGWRTLQGFDVDRMWDSLGSIGPMQWALALLATAGSFAALGRYDVIWHKLLGTGVDPTRAARVGMASIAVGQALGANAVTSGLARWRGLPGLGLTRLATLSAGVGLSFMVTWGICAVLVAGFVGLLPGPDVLIMTMTAAALLPALSAAPLVWRNASLGMLIFTALDLALAGTVLWLLLPASVEVSWPMAVSAYVLALGLGLISNSPGGLGPFELVLLMLLPHVPAEELVAALLAFRVVYYLVPFVIGAAYLAQPAPREDNSPQAPAAWGLARQSGTVATLKTGQAHVLHPLGIPVLLGDPTADAAELRTPVYKAGPALAAALRARGWVVARIADEAHVPLRTWSLDGSSKKRLRQALRRAAARGVTVERAQNLPLAAMDKIASHWAKTHGGELGLTVGRYCPRTVRQQEVLLIHVDGRLAGFVTCDVGATDWALDLIRYRGDLPEGAVHVALHHAITLAQAAGAQSFDLGAVPSEAGPIARWASGKEGLRRFKSLYAPVWSPRYFAAPNYLMAAAAATGLALGIQRPIARYVSRTHHLYAAFGVALTDLLRHTGVSPETAKALIHARQCSLSPPDNPDVAPG